MTTAPRLGWRNDLEPHQRLHATATPWTPPARYSAPAEFDPRPLIRVEDQGQQGSCAGHAQSTTLELCNLLQGGESTQLSRQYAYITGQQECGLLGQDQGCTITGVIEAAKKHGGCPEELWPYTGRYDTRIPQPARDKGRQHLIRQHAVMQSYQDCLAFLQTGQGGIVIGISWTEGLSNCRGEITTHNSGGQSYGGHAIALLGWDKRGWIWLANSHSERWGNGGWALCEPAWIDQSIRHQWSEYIGVSDLSETFGEARGNWQFTRNPLA